MNKKIIRKFAGLFLVAFFAFSVLNGQERNDVIKFYNEEWVEDGVYQTTDFVEKFGISRHLAGHYLYKVMTLQEHLLFRYKKHNKSYYIKRTCKYMVPGYENPSCVVDALSQAEQFRKDGLKVRIDK